jgi:transposase
MLNTSPHISVILAVDSTDLRKSVDGLSLIVSEHFNLDPFSKSLFVFCNRKCDKIKMLQWDHTGFWLHYKRLENDTFQWPDANGKTHLEVDERVSKTL